MPTESLLRDPQSEAALVATALADARAWPDVEHVHTEALSEPTLRAIWGLLREAQGPLDVGILAQKLSSIATTGGRSLLEHMGGRQALADLYGLARSHDQAAILARIVLECAANRSLQQTLYRGLDLLDPAGGPLSAQQRIDRVVSSLSRINIGAVADRGEYSDGIARWEKQLEWQLDNPGQLAGLRVGWKDLDEGVLGGLGPGNFLVLASSPGEGKSILAGEMAHRLATIAQDNGKRTRVGFWGVEMTADEIFGRFVCSRSGVDSEAIRRGRLTSEEQEVIREAVRFARAEIVPNLFYFGPSRFSTIDDITHQARYLVRQEGISCIFVDYIQRVGARERDKRTEMISEITTRLKSLAAQLGVPVVAVSQITRDAIKSQNGRPTLFDMAESAGVERDADYVLGLWRPARHLESDKARRVWDNVAVLELLKGRFRKASDCFLRFDGGRSRFDGLDQETIARLRSETAQAALRPRSSSRKGGD